MAEIVEVGVDDPRLDAVLGTLLELRTHLSAEGMRSLYADAHPLGYRVVGLFEDDACPAAASYRLGVSFANGRYLYVEDLVTRPDLRSRGHGKRLLDHLVALAADAGCDCVTLDSGVHRLRAHRFYMREGFVISSHHFYRRLRDGAGASVMRET